MNKNPKRETFMERIAAFIVDRRNLIFFIYALAIGVCCVTQGWVRVNNDLTSYLPGSTETRRGLTIMSEELVTYGTARIMVSHVTCDAADELADRIAGVEGVNSVTFDHTQAHFKGTDALLDVTFDAQAADAVSQQAMAEIKTLLAPYDTYISSQVGYSLVDTLGTEMALILAVGVVIIILVLLLTSRSYAEIPVLLLTFGAAAMLNMGTNCWFGEISFVSDSVAVVLQLALAIDYAIILLHRFTEEREHTDDRTACVRALSYSIPAISASSLTTVSGLAAMMFMQFRVGFDMGIVLIKAILFSMLSVFTLMPGLLILFSGALLRTRHREFLPSIDGWGRLVVRLRHVAVPLFAVILVGGFLLSSDCPYNFGYTNIKTSRQNEMQIAQERIDKTFGSQNVMALVVPRGDYDSEKALLERLEVYDEVEYAMGLANIQAMDGYTLTDRLTPRQFSELVDMDYEVIQLLYAAYAAQDADYGRVVSGLDSYAIPLMDMFLFLCQQREEGYLPLDGALGATLDDLYDQLMFARAQMLSDDYSRMIVALNLPEEGEQTFRFLQTVHREAERYYDADQVYLVGNSTSDYDLSVAFDRDNIVISVLSIAFVILVLLFTFQSVGLPVLLILVIQGSIWINFSFPTLTGEPVFFMSYLIISAIQMGANIDYAIVISSRYLEMKQLMPPREAVVKALSLAFPTVFTSGTIMASAAFLIGNISTEPSIVGVGECMCRGTLISMFLVMFVLPQLLLLGDLIVEKTSFRIKPPEITRSAAGTILVSGRVRGHVSGLVDAEIHGVIHGDVSAIVELDTLKEQNQPEEQEVSGDAQQK